MALQAIIEMRQVNEIQRGGEFFLDPSGGCGNPARGAIGRTLRGFHARRRPPKAEERKFPQVRLDLRAEGIGPGINIKNLAAVGPVDRTGRQRIIHARIHVEPPKTIGDWRLAIGDCRLRAERVPDFGRLNQVVGLPPKLDLGQVAMVPAIAHDAMLRRRFAGEIIGLGGAGDCGKSGDDMGQRAAGAKRRQARRVLPDQRLGEAHDINDRRSLHGAPAFGLSRATAGAILGWRRRWAAGPGHAPRCCGRSPPAGSRTIRRPDVRGIPQSRPRPPASWRCPH